MGGTCVRRWGRSASSYHAKLGCKVPRFFGNFSGQGCGAIVYQARTCEMLGFSAGAESMGVARRAG
jgi:hypothetical protein